MIPLHLQGDYDALTDAQKEAFQAMVNWSNAGAPGQILLTDGAFESILRSVKQMGAEPVKVIEPDKTLNPDWEAIKPK